MKVNNPKPTLNMFYKNISKMHDKLEDDFNKSIINPHLELIIKLHENNFKI